MYLPLLLHTTNKRPCLMIFKLLQFKHYTATKLLNYNLINVNWLRIYFPTQLSIICYTSKILFELWSLRWSSLITLNMQDSITTWTLECTIKVHFATKMCETNDNTSMTIYQSLKTFYFIESNKIETDAAQLPAILDEESSWCTLDWN